MTGAADDDQRLPPIRPSDGQMLRGAGWLDYLPLLTFGALGLLLIGLGVSIVSTLITGAPAAAIAAEVQFDEGDDAESAARALREAGARLDVRHVEVVQPSDNVLMLRANTRFDRLLAPSRCQFFRGPDGWELLECQPER